MSDSYRQTTERNDANFLLGDIAHAGSKRVAPQDAYAPQKDFSSLKTISHKRRRVECPVLLDLVPRTSCYCTPVLASFRMRPHPLVNRKDGPSSCYQRELEHRTLVYQVTPRLRPLWELGSADEFKNCYIDIVQIHFRAYENGILHRDISDETALVHKSDRGAVGCLVDRDLACSQDYPADGEALRRGTGPFVAIDLQFVGSNGKLQPQTHRYYHDLESLLWVLAWALMHFDIPNGRRLDCKLPGWGKGTWSEAALFKSCFIHGDCHTMGDYLRGVLPPYKRLALDRVVPLMELFGNARRAATEFNTDDLTMMFDAELYAGEVTFEKYIDIIRPRQDDI